MLYDGFSTPLLDCQIPLDGHVRILDVDLLQASAVVGERANPSVTDEATFHAHLKKSIP